MTNRMLASFMTVLLWADMPSGYNPSLLSSPVRTTTIAQDAVTQGAMAQGVPLAEGGTQMLINGQVVPIAWVQWQADGVPRLAINEQQLMQYFGVDLRDTDRVGVQPVQWFSDPATTPLPLSARLYRGVRYLDITPLMQQFGWQVSGQGAALQLTLPPSQVTEVRQGQRQIGSRTVIQLSQPTIWQATQEGQMLLVTVNATAASRLVSQFRPTPGNLVKDALRHRSSPKLSMTTNSTVIRLPIPANTSPQIFTLPDPARIVIDFRPDAMVNRDILWAPGLRWRQQYITIESGQFPIIWLEVDPRQPGLQLRPIWGSASTILGIEPVLAMAQRWRAIAAINGGFFSRNTYSPLGAIRRDGVWYSSPILNRGAIAWSNNGTVAINRLALSQTITTNTGQSFSLLHTDSGYIQAGLARYTSAWGNTYSPLTDNEVVMTVFGNQVVGQQALGKAGDAAIPVPADGYLLVARSYRTAANALPPGTIIQLTGTTMPPEFQNYPHIVGGGPLLLQARQIVLDAAREQFSNAFITETAVRSAIATLPNGNLAIVTVQHRINGRGPTLAELAQVMQQLGAVDALNLDGGSSTTLYLGGQILNRSPRTTARVHNSIGIFLQDTD